MDALKALADLGQAVWLDFLARGFIAKGELKALVDDGVRGVTSNPSIFEKAIGHGDEYDDGIKASLKAGDVPLSRLYERLAVADIQAAADVLRPVNDALGGADGFVSMEVSPYLANDTAGTVAEARRLWQEIDRPDVMIKVPATPAGLPAIRTLTSEGINVNITLLFAQSVYAEVVEAYLSGLEAFAAAGGDVHKVSSVASFFVSRIDTEADKRLDEKIEQANDAGEKARLAALKGKVAIANAKLAYQLYLRRFSGPRWEALAAKGARAQRLLWASTGTKNKAYSDTLYVDELIGRNTVNTVPPATLEAFRDHGTPKETLTQGVAEAEKVLADFAKAGLSLDAITDKLTQDGVKLFADAFDQLLGAVAGKRAAFLGERLNRQALALGPCQPAADEAAERWRSGALIRRLWQRDATVWTNHGEDKWLGWLDAIEDGIAKLADYEAFAQEVKKEGFTDALLLGMGGSSLGPEVLALTFGNASGFPILRIVDSTDPAQIRAAEAAVDLAKTLFIVSSKSGSTTEPNILKDYFFDRVAATIGADKAASRFVAVTDPGSSLEKLAKSEGFRRVFLGDPAIGGRYSVLSPFGLVPAAAAGIDLRRLLESARTMAIACGGDVPPGANPGVQLGLAMAAAAKAGRDKVTIVGAGKARWFGAWAEQLLAESTGKNGKGLIPVDGEPLGPPRVYGKDRLFIHLRMEGDREDGALAALEKAGHPVVRIVLSGPEAIGQEFFRWEIATAVAGAEIGIDPFDQPDVEASKVKTRELTAEFERTGKLPETTPVATSNALAVFADPKNAEALRKAGADGSVDGWLKAQLGRVEAGDYVAILAYVARNGENAEILHRIRMAIRDERKVATCCGFGPRFLHSTGQAYKGGPDSGVFLQVTSEPSPDLPIPGYKASFGIVEAAQAEGDLAVLAERGRRALRIHLKGDVQSGLNALQGAVERALA
ncbi:MAG TPA: bifunctional transaldolase/phosoglucose isomerase [Hyphomicrobiales bacterium]|nr:bifunctional transaldolase/phosoglucose isomerase [Hyphomicrobiales bacterium]